MNHLDYFMGMAKLASERSTCLRRKVGAVAVKQDRLIATGFNGQVSGTPHCSVCIRETKNIPSGTDLTTCFSVHAEQNLLVQASLYGISLEGSTIYVTNKPCFTCIKLLASVKPLAIIYCDDYPDSMTQEFMERAEWISTRDVDTGVTVMIPPKSFDLRISRILRGFSS